MIRTAVRRLLKLAVIGVIGAIVVVWFRNRNETADELSPEWPPLTVVPPPDAEAAGIAEPTDGAAAPPPEADWIDPDAEGDCPISHPIKVKLRSGIYHVPGGASYERTNADRCYANPGDAEADGYRASKT